MRIAKGNIVIGANSNGRFEFEYADEVAFAYNPLFLNIRLFDCNLAKLKVLFEDGTATGNETRSVEVALYQGKARVYYSRILELFFTNVKQNRSKLITISIMDGTTLLHQFQHTIIWGAIAMGERLESFGVFKFDKGVPHFERVLVWFKAFPFSVTLFRSLQNESTPSIMARYDESSYDATLNIFPPRFTLSVHSLSELCTTEIPSVMDSCPNEQALQAIVFVEDNMCFYGQLSTNNYCKSWGAQNRTFLDSTWYNGVDNKARKDIVWSNLTTGLFYKFDTLTNRLKELEFGSCRDNGLFELIPSHTFPDAKRVAVYRINGLNGSKFASLFDNTFDYTFHGTNEFTSITKLIVSNQTEGHYLRWIDRFGCIQYFLFSKGESTIKTKISSDNIEERTSNFGMRFPNHKRVKSIDGERTLKGQACALSKEIYDYVSTILTSPIIDLYIGKTKTDEEIWCPVNIEASSCKIQAKDVLHNLEITFSLPDIQAQTL